MAIRREYHQLSYEDRCQLEILKKNGLNQREIADLLSVDRSTISRELRRNRGKRGYRHKQAHSFTVKRRADASRVSRKMTLKVTKFIEKKLREEQWSPEQIAGWMKRNMKISVTHETIYKHVWAEKKNGGDLYKNLRHSGKKYNKRSGKNAGRGLIPNRVDIEERPKIVEKKIRIGDWEVDTVIGKNHKGAIVSVVERVTKFTKMALVESKKAHMVTKTLINTLDSLSDAVLTLTADNGKEFSMHELVTQALDAAVYFAKPYRSWERPLNEHTNGLIRQYFPKKTRFDILDPEDVQRVEDLLNSRPRKILDFRTPLEAFNQARFRLQNVALRS